MKIILPLLLLITCSMLWGGCSKDQAKTDDELILKYLSDHHLTAQKDASGLYYIITTPGTSGSPTLTSQVSVYYRGTLLDGTQFDSNIGGSILTFALSAVITGWQVGIPKFQKGGVGTLFIPSGMGYGSQATGAIPANSVLIFEVQLVNFSG